MPVLPGSDLALAATVRHDAAVGTSLYFVRSSAFVTLPEEDYNDRQVGGCNERMDGSHVVTHFLIHLEIKNGDRDKSFQKQLLQASPFASDRTGSDSINRNFGDCFDGRNTRFDDRVRVKASRKDVG